MCAMRRRHKRLNIASTGAYRSRNHASDWYSHRPQQRQKQQQAQRHALQPERSERSPATARSRATGKIQHAFGKHSVFKCALLKYNLFDHGDLQRKIVGWYGHRGCLGWRLQKKIKKAAFSRGLLELFRYQRCQTTTTNYCCFGALGDAGLAPVPLLGVAGFVVAGEAAGAGTPDCTL